MKSVVQVCDWTTPLPNKEGSNPSTSPLNVNEKMSLWSLNHVMLQIPNALLTQTL